MRTVVYIPPTKRRKMTKARRTKIFLARNGVCHVCKLQIVDGETWDVEHPGALNLGGSDDDGDLWPVHVGKRGCHEKKTGEDRKKIAARNTSIDRGYAGRGKRRRRLIPGSKGSGLRKRMNGQVERW